jgi:hypothetical protein
MVTLLLASLSLFRPTLLSMWAEQPASRVGCAEWLLQHACHANDAAAAAAAPAAWRWGPTMMLSLPQASWHSTGGHCFTTLVGRAVLRASAVLK